MSHRFCIYFVFCMLFLMPSSYAEDKKAKSNNPYDYASASQIKEAQSYYEYCKNDKVMSEKKDCRCASAAYLDARMGLGDDASKKVIARQIRDRCYKYASSNHDKSSQTSKKIEKDDDYFKDVTDKQIEEAQGVYLSCTQNPTMSRYNDCECLASSFLELRLQQGPIPREDALLMELNGKCKDSVQSVGAMYSSCMGSVSNDQFGFDRTDYCECYAHKWVEQYEALQGGIGMASDVNMRATAQVYCQSMAGVEAKKRHPEEVDDSEPAQ